MSAIDLVAELMTIAATTSPKSKGENFVQTKVITGTKVKELADAMLAYGNRTKKKDFDRDAVGVARAAAVVLIGLKDATVLGLNCAACGYPDCKSLNEQGRSNGEFSGPHCALRLLDMGIALGSAVKTASLFNVDNRIMYRIGAVARHAGVVDWDFIMGIPLSVSGKNVFFDR